MTLVRCLLLLVLTSAAAFAAPPSPYPDTTPGRRAAAYVEAFNRGDEAALRSFFTANLAADAAAKRPLDERITMNRRMRQEHGELTPVRVIESAPDRLVMRFTAGGGDTMDLTFECEPQAPNGLLGIRVAVEAGGGDHAGAVAPAPTPQRSDAEALATWRATLDSLTRAGQFSGVTLVARGDQVLARDTYGLASRERKVSNTTDTRFNIGSINKMFTKLAIGQLVEQGRVKLDDTIDHYLPDYPKAVAGKVTVRQLLEHRGGVGDIFGEAYDRADKSKLRTVNDWIALFRDQPLRFEPGSRQQYSNGGYVLLGAIVERVTGADYYDYIRHHVTAPLGMTATDYAPKDERGSQFAEGYTREDDSKPWRNNADTRPMRGSPAGGGYSTLDDLFRFAQAIRGGKLLNPAVAKDGFQELAPEDGNHMGLGMGGGARGINAAVSLEGPYTIIVLANLDPPAAEHAAAALRGLLPLPERRVEHRVGGSGEHQVRISAREDAVAAGAPVGGRRVVAQAPDGSKGVEVEMAHMHDGPDRSHIPAAPVSVEMGRSGHIPVVSVKINGRGPYRFGLDTGGAGSARIDSALAASLGLETVGQARAGDPSGKNMLTVDLVQVKSIEIGGARFEGVIAPIRSETLRWKGEPIVGILGFNLFRDCLLTLDFPGNRLTLARGELPPANGADVVDYEERHGIPAVRMQVDTTWVDADVDCGSMGGFSLPDRLAGAFKLTSELKVVGHARTVSNEFDLRGADLDGTVRIGGVEFANPMLTFQPLFPMGNIGSKVLKDFRLTFDQRNHRMRLVRGVEGKTQDS